MQRITLRPVHPDDLEPLRKQWNRSAKFDPMSRELFAEKTTGDPSFHPSYLFCAESGGELAGFAMAALWRSPDTLRGSVKLLAVAPEHRRKGIGSALLKATEERLLERKVETIRIAETSPNYLTPGLDVRYTPGWVFVQKHGYEKIGETFNLEADLTAEDWSTEEKEKALVEEGITVRRADESDRPTLEALLDTHWPGWRSEVARALSNEPITLHIAVRDETVLGFSAYDANNLGTGWFGPMGTTPEARGLGIGRVLLRRCLRNQKEQGHEKAIIPWVGPVGFYARHAGATIARVFHRFEKRIRS